MGAGKSKIGRHLANELGFPFIDTDKEIEKKVGKTVKEIFETDGEAVFRELEHKVVKECCESPMASVIALGGGALNYPESFDIVHKSGIVVYLKSSPAAIFERVKHTNKRPLLEIEDDENKEERLRQRIEQLLEKREPVYAKADIIIERDGLEVEQVVGRLLSKIKELWKQNYAAN